MIPNIPGIEFPPRVAAKLEMVFRGSKPGGILEQYANSPGWQLEAEAEAAIMACARIFMENYLKKPPLNGDIKGRGVHVKPHGIFANLSLLVEPHLPRALQTPFFQPGAIYEDGYGRSSSGLPFVGHDFLTGGGLGLALKFDNVPGRKVLPDEKHTQDFLILNHPLAFVGDARTYVSFLKAQGSGRMKSFFFPSCDSKTWHLLELKNLLGTATKINVGPLNKQFSSQTAHQHGEHEVRYAVIPRQTPWVGLPKLWHYNYHRETLVRQLRNGRFVLDFMVQRRLHGEDVNNPMIAWRGPCEKIATIIIPPQEFDTPQRDKFGENLFFSVGHTLLEQRPIGEIACTRMVIYWLSSILRHWLNGVEEREPPQQ